MFFDNTKCSYMITGVYYVDRKAGRYTISKKRDHTAIAYRIKGNTRFECNDEVVEASSGDVVYIPACKGYERTSVDEKLIIIHLRVYGKEGDKIETVNNVEDLEPLFKKLLNTWEEDSAGSYNRSMQILYNIFELLQKVSYKEGDDTPQIIKPGVELLGREYRNPSLRIKELSDACFISEVYFRELFLKHYGQTPQNMLMEMRFKYVCELLRSGYYSQKDAASYAGFSNVKYFRTSFKKWFGITPSEYIKNNQ